MKRQEISEFKALHLQLVKCNCRSSLFEKQRKWNYALVSVRFEGHCNVWLYMLRVTHKWEYGFCVSYWTIQAQYRPELRTVYHWDGVGGKHSKAYKVFTVVQAQCTTCINSIWLRLALMIVLLCQWGNGTEWLSHQPKITQLGKKRAGIWTQLLWLQSSPLIKPMLTQFIY